MARQISAKEYKDKMFRGGKRSRALEHALDIRKFEIELYWKRATYFWTFIGASLGGYVAVQHADRSASSDDLSVVLTELALVFSFAWYCANRGSKQWQENWENHVDLLENKTIGPLYKTVLLRPSSMSHGLSSLGWATEPGPFSVTKINQIVSLFMTALSGILFIRSLWPIDPCLPIDKWRLLEAVLAICAIGLIHFRARTSTNDFRSRAILRENGIEDPPSTA